MPKTNAEKCRDYRQRKRKENKVVKVSQAKSSTERVREFRARRKTLPFNEQHNIYIAQNNTSTVQNSENDHRDSGVDVLNVHVDVSVKNNIEYNDYVSQADVQPEIPYSQFRKNKVNMFGYTPNILTLFRCSICDRLWYRKDLKSRREADEEWLHAEDIIASVYHYLQSEYDQLKSFTDTSSELSPLSNILARTAAATGVSEQTVSAILDERKRPADCRDTSTDKRAKLTHDYGDGDVSPIDEELSSGVLDDAHLQEIKPEDDGRLEQDDFEIDRFKVEVEYGDDYSSSDPLEPQSLETDTAVQHPSSFTDVMIKIEPPEVSTEPPDVSTQSAIGVYPQTNTAVQHLSSFTDVMIKIEPVEVSTDPPEVSTQSEVGVYPQSSSGVPHLTSPAPVRTDPYYGLPHSHRFHTWMEKNTDGFHEERNRKRQINDSSDDQKLEERNRKNREKCKRYRERKKNGISIVSINVPLDPEERKREEERRQRNREKTRRYREKKKHEVAAVSFTDPYDSDEKRRLEERKQKNREKTRRYREKKKNEITGLSMTSADSSSDFSGINMEQARQEHLNVEFMTSPAQVKTEPDDGLAHTHSFNTEPCTSPAVLDTVPRHFKREPHIPDVYYKII